MNIYYRNNKGAVISTDLVNEWNKTKNWLKEVENDN